MIERIRDFRRSLEDSVSERREASAYGTGLFVDSLPDVYDLNYLRAERRADAAALAAECERLMEPFLHRKVVTVDVGATGGFRALGWRATPHLVMARVREPDRRVDTSGVREVPFDEIASARAEASEAEYGDRQLAERLNEAKRRVDGAVDTRWFAAFDGRRVAAYCELRSRKGVAQIEDVNTIEELRERGLGRTIVQHALDEARRNHDVVFLEALEEDWPRKLYAKLGFDVVDRRHLFLLPPSPLFGLRLRTPRLELRLGTVAELRELAAVAKAGVHPPEEMPFEVAWTDASGSPSFEDDFVEFHRSALAGWGPASWRLELLAFHEGHPVGTQGIGAERFAEEATVVTGSWLGAAWQGRGLGTEMRAAVLTLAFDALGAAVARSGALAVNVASLGVSRKLGYETMDSHLVSPRGEPVEHTDLELRRAAFRSPVPVEVVRFDGLQSLFGTDRLA